jgi:branched-chain amino acid transport system substrate-binding protein
MKRLFYVCSVLALVTSFTIAGGRTYAAHQAAASHASLMKVKLCSSTPIGIPSNKDLSQGIFNGVILATSQWKAKFAAAGMKLGAPLLMDYAKADGSGYDVDIERQNALKCLAQSDSLGYIGTLNSGASLVSEPILNRGGMAMVSPSNTNPSLTTPSGRAAQEPATFSGKLKFVTYFRTVTTDALQGPAGAAYAKTGLGAKSYFLIDDKLTYGAGLAAAFTNYAQGKLSMTQAGTGHIDASDSASIATSSDSVSDQVVSSKADIVYCGCNVENTLTLVRDLRAKGFTKPFLAGDAVALVTSFITTTKTAAENTYATSVGPDPAASSKSFLVAYKKQFHRGTLGGYDATSYDAASIVLNAIYNAQKAGQLKGSLFNKRAAVAKNVGKAHWKGAIGLTTFDKNGDTSNHIISIYAVKNGAWKYEAQAPNIKGIPPA